MTDHATSSGARRLPPGDGARRLAAAAMSTERWERVQQIFAAAIDCDPGTLNAVLDRECGGDADVRRQVESLLEAHHSAGRWTGFSPTSHR